MAIIPLRQLGTGGLNADRPAFDLNFNEFTNVVNCIFRDGTISKAEGWKSVTFPGDGDLDFDSFWFQVFADEGTIQTAFLGDTEIKIWNGSALQAATTPAITTSLEKQWISELYGVHVLATNGLDNPISTSGSGLTWTELPGWTDVGAPNEPCTFVRSFKSLIFAGGFSANPYTLAWSDVGKLGEMPQNWDNTDTGSFAGTLEMSAADGPLVDAAVLGDYLIVYTQFAAYAVSFTGQIQNPVAVRRLFSWGLIGLESVKAYENMHFCVDDTAIYVHDGSRVERIAHERVEDSFFSAVADPRAVKVAINQQDQEVLVYYSDTAGSGDVPPVPNKILIWNWQDNTFSFEDPQVEIHCIKSGAEPGSITTWDDLDALGWTWDYLDENNITWNDLEGKGQALATFQLQTRKWSLRNFSTQRDGVNYYAYVERLYLDMDELTQTTQVINEIQRILPQMIGGGGSVWFEIGFAHAPNGQVTWNGQREWTFGEQYKLDFRAAGRYLCWRLGVWPGSVPAATPGNWRVSSMDVEVIQDGYR